MQAQYSRAPVHFFWRNGARVLDPSEGRLLGFDFPVGLVHNEGMSYQRRIILTYSLLVGLLAVIFGAAFYVQSARSYLERASDDLRSTAADMRTSVETLLRPMDFVAVNVVSNSDVLAAMSDLMKLDRMDADNAGYLNEARQTVRDQLYNYSLNKTFHRVSVFNLKGDFFSSYFDADSLDGSRSAEVIDRLEWLSEADAADGRFVLLPPSPDAWLFDGEAQVFSLVRSVRFPKPGTGYVEVQNDASLLAELFATPQEEARSVVAFDRDGSVFWTNAPSPVVALLDPSKLPDAGEVAALRLSSDDPERLVAMAESKTFGLRIVLMQDRSVVLAPVNQMGLYTAGITLLIAAASAGFVALSARRLAKPIRELRARMEDTEIVNLMESFDTRHDNDEIEALNTSFQNLRLRLNDALMREIRANSLQMEASLDSLQAHVNPHFIYNILNVLSNKSLTTGDEEIGEICAGISDMLRYSTNTDDRGATVAEELRHVGNYLLLMKKRFEHKLEYEIDIAADILTQPIPKIVLQQIAENALNHGFVDIQTIMRLTIRGHGRDGRWFIEVLDNGQGFAPDTLDRLESQMAEMKDSLLDAKRRRGFHIGGMGLVNTYGRMLLFYGGDLCFELENRPEGGALVRIGGRLRQDADKPLEERT